MRSTKEILNAAKAGESITSGEAIKAGFDVLTSKLENTGIFNPVNVRQGRSGQVRMNASRYKGGILEASSINLPDDAAAGSTYTATWTGNELNKFLGTTLSRMTMKVYGAADAEAGKISVTLRINGESVPELTDVPLGTVMSLTDGSPMYAEPDLLIPEYCSVELTVSVDKALTGTPGQFTEIYPVAYCDASPGEAL